MALKAKIEAIIYAAEEPITVEQISALVKDIVIAELAASAVVAPEEPTGEYLEGVGRATEPSEGTSVAGMAVSEDSGSQSQESQTGAQLQSTEPQSAESQLSESQSLESHSDELVAAGSDECGHADSVALEAPDSAVVEAPGEAVIETTDAAVVENAEAAVKAPDATRGKRKKSDAPKKELSEDAKVRARVREVIEELVAEYDREERGMEIRQIAGGYRMGTKPEHHDVVRAFAKSLKPAVRLSLAALETLAVIAYKQPVTVPEISEIRGVEAAGVIGTLLDRKLITTAGRKQVIGRPILYKTSKEFLMRFGLNEVSELPSMEEFEKLANEGQGDLFLAGSESAPGPESEATLEDGEAEEQFDAPEAPDSETSANPDTSEGGKEQPAAGSNTNEGTHTAGSE